jgi:signal transduction histidine kinase
MDWLASHLEPLLAVAAATLDESGRLIEANRGFLRLLEGAEAEPQGSNVAPYFIQPDFATLLRVPAAADGEVHHGLLTIGDYMGRTRSLPTRIWRSGGQLRLLAEFDIAELERICETTFELNCDYANAQTELAQNNLKLQQRETRLQQLVAELTQANQERQRAQVQLLQAEKLASIGSLAAGVAHEINNPIGFVNSNLGTLAQYVEALMQVVDAYDSAAVTPDASVASVKAKTGLDFIRKDVGNLIVESRDGLARVKRIVQALTDFSKTQAGETWGVADINAGLESTLSLLTNELQHCELRRELGTLPPVECVLDQLNTVFMNLLLNAAQAIEGHGVLSIRSGITGDEVWIEVSDTGQGIPSDILPHIFDPFFTTKPVGLGTGLGLSVSYGIVSRHHGRIEVDSTVGRGSRFRVCLPVRQAA